MNDAVYLQKKFPTGYKPPQNTCIAFAISAYYLATLSPNAYKAKFFD